MTGYTNDFTAFSSTQTSLDTRLKRGGVCRPNLLFAALRLGGKEPIWLPGDFHVTRGGQWTKGKSGTTFGPLGPWLLTPDEIGDVQNLDRSLDVNGKHMQTSSTSKMIFPIATLVSYISRFMRLMPGDVITTGTPPGVRLDMKPPVFLKPGDVVELGIDGLGRQHQIVTAFSARDHQET